MKNLNRIALPLVAGIFFIQSCNQAPETIEQEVIEKEQHVVKRTPNENGLMIAYYVQDSIATNFNYYRTIDSTLKAKSNSFENQLRGKYENYYEYENMIRQRMESGEITGYQIDAVQQEVMQKQEAIANFERQRGTELQNESIKYQNALMNKISEAGREFSEENGFDMLFFYAKGGQITYISNAYDVTLEFMDFLNKREAEIITGVEKEVEESDAVTETKGLNLNP